MALPAGALGATVTVGSPIDIAGTAGTLVSLRVRPEVPAGLVWAADGTPVEPWSASATLGEAPVTALTLTILADQAGVLTSGTVDGAPQMVAVRAWPLVAEWSTKPTVSAAPTKHVRRFAAPAPGTTVDLDLLPQDGALPVATITTAQTITYGGAGVDAEGVQDVVGAMIAAAGGTYDDAAGTITLPGGGSSTITADDTPAAPAEGESASHLVTSAVSWPAGLVWSTDPDGGVAPTITGTALVSMFTVGGTTRAIMGATFPAPAVPDTTAPTVPAGLSATATSSTTVNLSWSASTDAGGVTGYEYAINAGAAVDAGAGTTETVSGLTAETVYSFTVRAYDAAGNRSAWSAAATDTTLATAPASATLADAILALSPVGYWKLDETTGTQATDYSGNARHGTYSGSPELASTGGFVKGGAVTIADSPVFELDNSGTGMTVFALWLTAWAGGEHRFIRKYGSGYEWAVQSTNAIGVRVWGTSDDLMGEDGPQNLEPHTWSAVAATFPNPSAGARVPLYRNSGTALTATQPRTYSGSYAGTTSPLTLIDGDPNIALGHVAIFPTQLTGAQVGALVDAARAEGFIA